MLAIDLSSAMPVGLPKPDWAPIPERSEVATRATIVRPFRIKWAPNRCRHNESALKASPATGYLRTLRVHDPARRGEPRAVLSLPARQPREATGPRGEFSGRERSRPGSPSAGRWARKREGTAREPAVDDGARPPPPLLEGRAGQDVYPGAGYLARHHTRRRIAQQPAGIAHEAPNAGLPDAHGGGAVDVSGSAAR